MLKGLCKDADVLHVAVSQPLWVESAAHGAAGKVHNERRFVYPRLVHILPPDRRATSKFKQSHILTPPFASETPPGENRYKY
jgi:hypothetical protein